MQNCREKNSLILRRVEVAQAKKEEVFALRRVLYTRGCSSSSEERQTEDERLKIIPINGIIGNKLRHRLLSARRNGFNCHKKNQMMYQIVQIKVESKIKMKTLKECQNYMRWSASKTALSTRLKTMFFFCCTVCRESNARIIMVFVGFLYQSVMRPLPFLIKDMSKSHRDILVVYLKRPTQYNPKITKILEEVFTGARSVTWCIRSTECGLTLFTQSVQPNNNENPRRSLHRGQIGDLVHQVDGIVVLCARSDRAGKNIKMLYISCCGVWCATKIISVERKQKRGGVSSLLLYEGKRRS
ncbi:unnamed protein product [Trichogramma brassicae]|uniref:Uncharacterized protein n=1 Tax=Trichogramma brassicae TaxID=86971 RepID=A0A6H5I957_9HYME|nr:unnamed protein product [Trichogramma brassicae]